MSIQLTQVCLAPVTMNGSLFARLIADHDLGFAPSTVRWSPGERGDQRLTAKALGRLAAAGELDWAHVAGSNDGEEFSLAGFAGHPLKQLIWRSRGSAPDDLVDAVAELPGFNAAYCGDADDVYWQSETSIAAYESAGRSHARLPKLEGGVFPWEPYQIDISANPGRRTPYDGILLWAASRMWFGARAVEHLGRERLLSAPVGAVSERAGGRVIAVDLFPLGWIGSRLDEVRDRQRTFRDWMGFDELETGTFEHGGVRRLTEWLDARGRPAPKSRAAKGRTVELSDDGQLLWESETQPG